MVEQDAGGGVQAEALAIIYGHPMAIELGHRIGAARVERRLLVLPRLLDDTVHLRGGRLIEPRPGAGNAHGLQNIYHSQTRYRTGQERLLPARGDKTLGRQIIDLVRLMGLQDPNQRG